MTPTSAENTHNHMKQIDADKCGHTEQNDPTTLTQRRTRNVAVVIKRTTAVYAEGGRNPLFKRVSRSQK